MKKIPKIEKYNKPEKLEMCLDGLKEYLDEAVFQGINAHRIEKEIWGRVLKIGHQAMGYFLAQQGQGDLGETFDLGKEQVIRFAKPQNRGYKTIFGEYCLERYVYGSREGQKATFIPLDTRLQLPESNYS